MTGPFADFAAVAGVPLELEPNLHLVLAPNPSPMTGPGTNTYLLGQHMLAVIDPGPADPAHFDSLLRAIDGRAVSHILVTHSHLDHSPLARPLAQATGASIYAFGDTRAGRSAEMEALAAEGMAGGGEGLDHDFRPDVCLADGDSVETAEWQIKVLHTPGHLGNHLAFVWNDAVFVGDTIMGWSTSLVSPPDGDMAHFLQSCERLAALSARVFYSGHGAPVTEPSARAAGLIAHRQTRTDAIIAALRDGPATVNDLVDRIYDDLAAGLKPAAGRNVFAHLVALHTDETVAATPALHPHATFLLVAPEKR